MFNPHTRTLHLIDIGNLHGRKDWTTLNQGCAAELLSSYRRTVDVGPIDQIRVACHPRVGLNVGLALGGGQLLVRPGRNGAGQALLDSVDFGLIAKRFGRVVIGSGNHIFADLVVKLLAADLDVEVVSLSRSLSRDLRETGAPVRLLGQQAHPLAA